MLKTRKKQFDTSPVVTATIQNFLYTCFCILRVVFQAPCVIHVRIIPNIQQICVPSIPNNAFSVDDLLMSANTATLSFRQEHIYFLWPDLPFLMKISWRSMMALSIMITRIKHTAGDFFYRSSYSQLFVDSEILICLCYFAF